MAKAPRDCLGGNFHSVKVFLWLLWSLGVAQFVPDPRFEEVKEYVRSGVFGDVNYDEMIGSLEGNEGYGRADYFLVGYDFPAYIEAQYEVDEAYRNQKVRCSPPGSSSRSWNASQRVGCSHGTWCGGRCKQSAERLPLPMRSRVPWIGGTGPDVLSTVLCLLTCSGSA